MGHACRPSVLAILYEALAERRLSLTFQEGGIVKPVVLSLPAFTLLATTTRPAKLPQPLRAHMEIREHVRRYEAEDLAPLARQTAAPEDCSLDEDSALLLSGGPVRLAALAQGVRDFAAAIPGEVERLADTLVVAAAAQGRKTPDAAFTKSVVRLEGNDALRRCAERALEFKGFGARHTCGRTGPTTGAHGAPSGRAD